MPEVEERESIGNQIPQWVSDADWDKAFYVMTSSDIDKFDAFAKEDFPTICDPGWTQEQSDAVYLGQGIEMFKLDSGKQLNRLIYYPVIMNGVIVSGYQVYEDLDNHEMGSQMSPAFVDKLNQIMELTTKSTPLILGFNRNNVIGVIGINYYVLDIDHMEHKKIAANEIIDLNKDTIVNALEMFCVERNADVDDWVIVD